MKSITFSVKGMTCPHCKASVESALKAVSGVNDAVADLETKQVTVNCETGVTEQALKDAVEDIGFDIE